MRDKQSYQLRRLFDMLRLQHTNPSRSGWLVRLQAEHGQKKSEATGRAEVWYHSRFALSCMRQTIIKTSYLTFLLSEKCIYYLVPFINTVCTTNLCSI